MAENDHGLALKNDHPPQLSSDRSRVLLTLIDRMMPLGHMNPATQALVEAMLWGQIKNVDPSHLQLLSRTGLVHLLSASGTHMLAFFTLAKLAKGPWPRRGKPWVEGIVLLGSSGLFALAGGATTPFLRAWALVALVSLGRWTERNVPPLTLALASFAFAGMAGSGSHTSMLLSFTGALSFLWAKAPYAPLKALLAPWIFTAPFTIYFFGQFSWTAPLWNLTFGTLITFTVLPLAFINLVAQKIGFSLLEQPILFWMEHLMSLLALAERWWPWSTAVAVPFSLFLPANILFLFIAYYLPKTAFSIGALFLVLSVSPPRPVLGLLNVGQGDSLYFHEKNLGPILLDAGPRRGNRAAMELQKRGIAEIHYIFLSHLDQDHRGGLANLLETMEPKKGIVLTQHSIHEERAEEILSMAESKGIPVRIWEKVGAPCWFPSSKKANDTSPFCRFNLRNGKTLFVSGDASSIKEREWLTQQSRPQHVDYLKLAHHGSRYSNSEPFLDALSPTLAMVGVGKNSYGHPHSEVLERLHERGIPLYRSDTSTFSVWW